MRFLSSGILFFSLSFQTFGQFNPKEHGRTGTQADHCREMEVAESRVVNFPNYASRSKVELKYTIHKINDEYFEVYLNPKFKMDKKYDGDAQNNDELNDIWRERFAQCYEGRGHALRDGQGRKIDLIVWDEKKHEYIPRPPRVTIKITDNSSRSHSRAYAKGVGCGTIIHEALHLTGLVDEYIESGKAWNSNVFMRLFKPFKRAEDGNAAFDCRPKTTPNSVMGSHYRIDWNKPVLKTGHLDAIIYPNCKQRNSIYYSCTGNAYRTSREHGGILGCKDVPDICQSANWAGY